MQVIDFTSYREFLKMQISAHSRRGYKSLLAKAANCHSSYLSQVLSGSAELTLEQAAGIADFWNLNELDREYFIELILVARAGTPTLRSYHLLRLEQVKQKILEVSNQIKTKNQISDENKAIYYSSWHYPLVHAAASIQSNGTIDEISKTIDLPYKVLIRVLQNLENMGLIKFQESHIISTDQSIHIGKRDPLYLNFHRLARQQANLNLQVANPEDLHYTAIHSVATKDLEKISKSFQNVIVESEKRVGDEAESLCVIAVDVFPTKQS